MGEDGGEQVAVVGVLGLWNRLQAVGSGPGGLGSVYYAPDAAAGRKPVAVAEALAAAYCWVRLPVAESVG